MLARFLSGSGAGLWAISSCSHDSQSIYRQVSKIQAHCIGILHRPAKVDFNGLEDEGNASRAEECIGLCGPAKLLADGRYPTYAAGLEEANCVSARVSPEIHRKVGSICTISDIIHVSSK